MTTAKWSNPVGAAPSVPPSGLDFWRELVTPFGPAGWRIMIRVLVFGVLAALVWGIESATDTSVAIDLTPYEIAGVTLSLLLVLRTNAGYERWWEARKLWGGITNQCRDLVVVALATGSRDRQWREQIARWTAAFAHVVRRNLRGERQLPELAALLGEAEAARVAVAVHMPSYVSAKIAAQLAAALEREEISGFAFLEADRDRALLLDHAGGCERIAATPLPQAYVIKIRQLVFLFLVALPFALISRVGWLTPLITIITAYPLLALDEIGAELQRPFSTSALNHLPLDDVCATIERNLLAQLEFEPPPSQDYA
ncbi:MAG TPA: bestrophin family ion channel [Pirellulales bacterium]|nr:bestrophin family ion channel [Pirellulales bacterium]